MPDLNRMLSLWLLYQFGTFQDPNGPRPDMKEACRIEMCQIASQFCGVYVAEVDQQKGQE